MTDETNDNVLVDAAIEVLRSGALDLNPYLNYTDVMRIGKKRGVRITNWDTLEQAARNVMQEVDRDGCMVWWIDPVAFGKEYAKLCRESEEEDRARDPILDVRAVEENEAG